MLLTASGLTKNPHPYTKQVQLVATQNYKYKNLGYYRVLSPFILTHCCNNSTNVISKDDEKPD